MARRTGHGLSERGRHWQGLLGAWERSGLTQTAFCRQQGVKHVTFCWWKRRLALRGGRLRTARMDAEPGARRPDGSTPAIFAPVHIRADEPNCMEGRIEIALAGGRRIRLRGRVDRQALVDVLAVLEAPAC
jgi:hypothetical protein